MTVAKHVQSTRVMLGDIDLSSVVLGATLFRGPGEVEQVDLKVVVERLEFVDDTLVIHLEQPKG